MPFYTEDAKSAFFTLLNDQNPTLPFALSAAEVNLSTLKVLPNKTPLGVNTEIYLFPKSIGHYSGRIKVQYRRLILDTLFRGITPEVRKWTPTNSSTSPFTVYDLLPILSSLYGIVITEDDVVNQAFPAGTTTDPQRPGVRSSKVLVTVKSTSLGFVGSFPFRWTYAERELSDLIVIRDLPARQYPGGNDFSGVHGQIINSEAFSIDFTGIPQLQNGPAFGGSHTLGDAAVIATQQPVFNYLNEVLGTVYSIDATHQGDALSLYGSAVKVVTLPSLTVPEANSPYYNHAVIVTPPPERTGVAGEMILHYNI